MGGLSDTKILQDMLLYAARAALSYWVLVTGLRYLDPNRESSKKALEQKKEIAKRLGRPLIQTNSYEGILVQHKLYKFNLEFSANYFAMRVEIGLLNYMESMEIAQCM
ncbi:hypothetical protein TSUD_217970 [Trifolium subterraneum]|uniref:Uncharacterized protein n=1 Tax=Trifolium subterraneum TaxID=3900 RepID=A0A2Z6MRA6_TRISU|nr:hypothetical protein TSUD_217970 [Trifolium subterraneum]